MLGQHGLGHHRCAAVGSRDALDAPSEAPRATPRRAQRQPLMKVRRPASCGMLDAGVQPDTAYDYLLAAARVRGRREPTRYASLTMSR